MAIAPLTRQALHRRDWELSEAASSDIRVKAYNLNGERLGVAGVGQGAQRLTFLSKMTVERILGYQHWIKEPPAGSPKWPRDLRGLETYQNRVQTWHRG